MSLCLAQKRSGSGAGVRLGEDAYGSRGAGRSRPF
jgi:hypothetical protein